MEFRHILTLGEFSYQGAGKEGKDREVSIFGPAVLYFG